MFEQSKSQEFKICRSVVGHDVGVAISSAQWRLGKVYSYDQRKKCHSIRFDGVDKKSYYYLRDLRTKWLVNPASLFVLHPPSLEKRLLPFSRQHPLFDRDLNSSWEWSYPAAPGSFQARSLADLQTPQAGWLAPHSILWRRLVGRRIQAYWMGDVTFYPGTILRYLPPGTPHPAHIDLRQTVFPPEDSHRMIIIYDDGDRQVKALDALRFAWMRDQEDGPMRAPGVAGLINMYNTCYLSAVLQCLCHTAPLARFFAQGQSVWACINRSNKFGTGGRLAEAFSGLQKALWVRGHVHSLAPGWVKAVLADRDATFNGMDQQDAHEALLQLLDGLHEDTAISLSIAAKTPSHTPLVTPRRSGTPPRVAATPGLADPVAAGTPPRGVNVMFAPLSQRLQVGAGKEDDEEDQQEAAYSGTGRSEGKGVDGGFEGDASTPPRTSTVEERITVSTSIVKRLFFVRTAELIGWHQKFTTDLDAASDGLLTLRSSKDDGHVMLDASDTSAVAALEASTASTATSTAVVKGSAEDSTRNKGWFSWLRPKKKKTSGSKVTAASVAEDLESSGGSAGAAAGSAHLSPPPLLSPPPAVAAEKRQLRLGPMGGELLPPIPVSYSVTEAHLTEVRRYKKSLEGPPPPPAPPAAQRVSSEAPVGSPARSPHRGKPYSDMTESVPTSPTNLQHKPGEKEGAEEPEAMPEGDQTKAKWWQFRARMMGKDKAGSAGDLDMPPAEDDTPRRRSATTTSKAAGVSAASGSSSSRLVLESKPLNAKVGAQRVASSLYECLDAYFCTHSTFRQAPDREIPPAMQAAVGDPGPGATAGADKASGKTGKGKKDTKVWQLGDTRTRLLAPLPPVLLFQLKRFEMVPVDERGRVTLQMVGDDEDSSAGGGRVGQACSWVMRKLPHAVRFPLVGLDMSRYVASDTAMKRHRRPSQVRAMAHSTHALSGVLSPFGGEVGAHSAFAAGESSPHSLDAGAGEEPSGSMSAATDSSPDPMNLYDLYGLVCHEGSSTEAGHYIALIKVGGSHHQAHLGDPKELVMQALNDLNGRESLAAAVQEVAGLGADASAEEVTAAACERLVQQPPDNLQQMPHGVGPDGGDATWYMFDDTEVTPIEEAYVRHKVVAAQAYLLFYARRG